MKSALVLRLNPSVLAPAAAVLLAAVFSMTTPADADLWGHLTFGRDIVMSGHVEQADAYSFTSDRAWVNHEWLSEVAFFTAYRHGGAAGLIALKMSLLGLLLFLVSWSIARRGVTGSARLWLLAVVVIGTHWRMQTIRPQLFSVVSFAALLAVLCEVDAGRRRWLLAVPPLMALWVNLHGGWIVGMGALGLWAAFHAFGRRKTAGLRLSMAAVLLATIGATLVNPYGPRMLEFLATTVRPDRGDIQDWNSVLSSPVALGLPWLLVLLAGGFASWRSDRPRAPYLALISALAMASFRTSRLDAFFAVAVALLLAPEFATWLAEIVRSKRPGQSDAPPAPFAAVAVTVLAIGFMTTAAGVAVAPYASCIAITGGWAPDETAMRFISTNHLRGRMVTWFDWGEYAIWHFGPALQVSIDGRRETVYSDRIIDEHWRFYRGEKTTLLRDMNPDYIWIPTTLPIADRLQAPDWIAAFRSSTSAIFVRPGGLPLVPVSAPSAALRCFPGP